MSTGVRHSVSAMAEARRLHENSGGAFTLDEIADQLAKTHGVRPSKTTVGRWLSPAQLAKARENSRRQARKRGVVTWQFDLASRTSPEYRAAFVRRLRDEQVPTTSIAKVCRVVFGDPTMNRYTIEQLLEKRAA